MFAEDIRYFNGSLFSDIEITGLGVEARKKLYDASLMNWRYVEPTIFGTLFERALDRKERVPLGAHYTSRDDIMLIVEPVLLRPLQRRWDEIRPQADEAREKYDQAKTGKTRTKYRNILVDLRADMLEELRSIKVLDPACGSGNFLYVALQNLLDMEKKVLEHRAWQEIPNFPHESVQVHPIQMYGIEKNTIAHALASIVVWIGYLQWRIHNNFHIYEEPILQDIHNNIQHKDAILAYDDESNPVEPKWPAADVIIGNPPFLGNKRIRGELGDKYTENLHELYKGKLKGFTDLVTYWYEKARRQVEVGEAKRVGLLATNSISMGTNTYVLQRIKDTGDIFMAWKDREWILDGAAVRVAMIGFDDGTESEKTLNGVPVKKINPDLTSLVNITVADTLAENNGICYQGIVRLGPFDIDKDLANDMLSNNNDSGLPNSDVVRPLANGSDIVRRWRNKYIIDFGVDTTLEQAKKYERPYQYIKKHVFPFRQESSSAKRSDEWWIHLWSRPEMREKIEELSRFLVTPAVSKFRIFDWLDSKVHPDHALIVFARDDDYFFGVLHSKLHEVWSLGQGTSLEDRPRYTPTSTFETFPFPWSPGDEDTDHPAYHAISAAAKQLHEERDAWLHPDDISESALKKRTLTNLYNAVAMFRGDEDVSGKIYPAAGDFAPRLLELHEALDQAVCDAYGWSYDVLDDEEEILRQLLALNLERAEAQGE